LPRNTICVCAAHLCWLIILLKNYPAVFCLLIVIICEVELIGVLHLQFVVKMEFRVIMNTVHKQNSLCHMNLSTVYIACFAPLNEARTSRCIRILNTHLQPVICEIS